MRTQRVLLAAVCGIGIAGFGATSFAQDQGPAPMPPMENRDMPKADSQAADALAVRQTLREVTNAAFTKGGFDDIVERFSDADRARFNKDNFTEEKHETLDGRIAQIQKDWQAKYKQEFNLTSAGTVFGPSFAAIGFQPTAVTASERRAPTEDANRRADNAPGNDRRFDRGDSATYPDGTVTIAESHGIPEVKLNMSKEAMGRWKVDVADTQTARQFHDNLLKQLTIFDEQKSNWPDSPDEGYRMAAHRVFLAVSNMEDKTTDDKPGDNTARPSPIRDKDDTAPFPPKPSETPAPRP